MNRHYSDIDYISGILMQSHMVEKAFYLKCRQLFVRGTANYFGINDEDKGDILQDAFIILWSKIQTKEVFVSNDKVYALNHKGEVREVPELSGYFMRIVKNKYLEKQRMAGRMMTADVDAVGKGIGKGQSAQDPFTPVFDDGEAVTRETIVMRCLMMLTPHCREVIRLFYVEGKSLDDILRMRGGIQSYKGLKTSKYKCLKKLKDHVHDTMRAYGLRIR